MKKFLLLSVVALFGVSCDARASVSQICDEAAAHVASETGVPLSVLQAITRTETGRVREGQIQPWPWTVNMEGDGFWFDSTRDALDYVLLEHSSGAQSFDVGCFQINFRWHGGNFASIEEMFDPIANARYAARFLSDLYMEKGNWPDAAGAYHSRTPELAERYSARFTRILNSIANNSDIQAGAETPISTTAANTFPLLQVSGSVIGAGSLVPIGGIAALPGLGAQRE